MIVASDLSPRLAGILRGKPKHPLRDMLDELAWSGAELSRRIGVHENTITWWMKRPEKTPKYATAYLELCLMVKRVGDTIEATGRARSKSR